MVWKVVGFLFKKAKNSEASSYSYTKPSNFTLQRQRVLSNQFSFKPLISIVVPTYNTPVQMLQACLNSVEGQSYPYWELCIADDNSSSEETKEVLRTWQQKENVKVVFRTENGHIAKASNSALELASGEFTMLLDHDDLLAPDALFEFVHVLQTQPSLDFIYSDEDKIDEEDRHFDPVKKPDWSPDTFLSWNFVCHLAMFRTSLLQEIGGFRTEYNGSQDYDLLLRVTEKTNRIYHIPKVVYHWRMHSQSVALNTHAKPYAYLNGKKALEDSLKRRGRKAEVEMHLGEMLGMYTARPALQDRSKISIIIPTKNCGFLVKICVESIFNLSTYSNFEIILIDNNSDDPAFFTLVEEYKSHYGNRFKVVRDENPFNFSALMNLGYRNASGEYLLLLNNDTKVITENWMELLLAQAQLAHTGAVGARLLFKNNTLQHNGIFLHENGIAEHVYSYLKENQVPPAADCVVNYPAVTAACLMVSKAKFEEVEGFDENLAVDYNDIDFCLKLKQKGYHNVCLPYVKLYHYESISRGKEKKSMEKYSQYLNERKNFTERWVLQKS